MSKRRVVEKFVLQNCFHRCKWSGACVLNTIVLISGINFACSLMFKMCGWFGRFDSYMAVWNALLYLSTYRLDTSTKVIRVSSLVDGAHSMSISPFGFADFPSLFDE